MTPNSCQQLRTMNSKISYSCHFLNILHSCVISLWGRPARPNQSSTRVSTACQQQPPAFQRSPYEQPRSTYHDQVILTINFLMTPLLVIETWKYTHSTTFTHRNKTHLDWLCSILNGRLLLVFYSLKPSIDCFISTTITNNCFIEHFSKSIYPSIHRIHNIASSWVTLSQLGAQTCHSKGRPAKKGNLAASKVSRPQGTHGPPWWTNTVN